MPAPIASLIQALFPSLTDPALETDPNQDPAKKRLYKRPSFAQHLFAPEVASDVDKANREYRAADLLAEQRGMQELEQRSRLRDAAIKFATEDAGKAWGVMTPEQQSAYASPDSFTQTMLGNLDISKILGDAKANESLRAGLPRSNAQVQATSNANEITKNIVERLTNMPIVRLVRELSGAQNDIEQNVAERPNIIPAAKLRGDNIKRESELNTARQPSLLHDAIKLMPLRQNAEMDELNFNQRYMPGQRNLTMRQQATNLQAQPDLSATAIAKAAIDRAVTDNVKRNLPQELEITDFDRMKRLMEAGLVDSSQQPPLVSRVTRQGIGMPEKNPLAVDPLAALMNGGQPPQGMTVDGKMSFGWTPGGGLTKHLTRMPTGAGAGAGGGGGTRPTVAKTVPQTGDAEIDKIVESRQAKKTEERAKWTKAASQADAKYAQRTIESLTAQIQNLKARLRKGANEAVIVPEIISLQKKIEAAQKVIDSTIK